MSITPCFVCVGNIEEKEKLIKYLLENFNYAYHACNNDSDIGIHCSGSLIYTFRPGDDFPHFNAIDCGDNIELFKGLAAMNDDNDYMQWFVYHGINKSEYFLCDDYDIEEVRKEYAHSCQSARLHQSRKATAKEIIDYFDQKN
jgi:hypothetical protein